MKDVCLMDLFMIGYELPNLHDRNCRMPNNMMLTRAAICTISFFLIWWNLLVFSGAPLLWLRFFFSFFFK